MTMRIHSSPSRPARTLPGQKAPGVDPPAGVSRPQDAVDAWLTMFERLLRWPTGESRSVRDELEGHLRERIRDLMLSGGDEDQSVRQAVAELGEAASLAQRYRAARRYPQRRLLMSAAMFTLAGAALGLSIVAVSTSAGGSARHAPADTSTLARPGDQPGDAAVVDAAVAALMQRHRDEITSLTRREKDVSGFLATVLAQAQPGGDGEGRRTPRAVLRTSVFQPLADSDTLANKRISGEFKEVPLSDVLEYVSKWAEMPVLVQWFELEGTGIGREAAVNIKVRDVSFPTFVRMLGEVLAASTGHESQPDYRIVQGHVEIATVAYFDQHEIELVSYDIAHLQSTVSEGDLRELIQTFVDTKGWRDNGGQNGEIKIVGSRMFIQAPRRYHRQIAWLLGELAEQPAGVGHSARTTPADPLAGAQPAGAGDAPKEVRVYALKHVAATEAAGTLRESHTLRDQPGVNINADARSNSLIVQGSADELRAVGQLLDQLDRPAAPDPAPKAADGNGKHADAVGARSFPIDAFDSMRVLQGLIEVWGPGHIKPITMVTDQAARSLVITGSEHDVAMIERLFRPLMNPVEPHALDLGAEGGQVVAIVVTPGSGRIIEADELSLRPRGVPFLADIPILNTFFTEPRPQGK